MSKATSSVDDRNQLTARFDEAPGRVFLTGMQALVRGVLDQARDDRRHGLDQRGFVSGYPGSPLGGLEDAFRGVSPLLDDLGIVLNPAVNEELAATAVLGATKREVYPDPGSIEGVTGVWYGKCNGVDRCVDVFKYGNYGGLPGRDAVVVLAGDDPNVKSSGIPGESEYTLAAAGMPVLYPATVAEMYEMTRHAIVASRLTGCWVSLKLTTDLCDGGATFVPRDASWSSVLPELDGFEKFDTTFYFGQPILDGEDSLYGARHEAFVAYVVANGLDRIDGQAATRGIIASGKAWADAIEALQRRGIGLDHLDRAGLRILKLGSMYPVDSGVVRRFADGLEEVLVLEEKRDFLEQQVARILYGQAAGPRLTGKKDADGRPLVPVRGELDADRIAEVFNRWLGPSGNAGGPSVTVRGPLQLPLAHSRTPNYCSGCPHSRATVSPEGSTVLGGIGCHSIGLFSSQDSRRYTMNVQMGGEGAPWVGASPFVGTSHVVQNLGDGTYFHSGSLAVRWCVTAGVNITFRILYNGHISMTGGQQIPGVNGVAAMTRELDAMGVQRIVVATEDPTAYRRQRLAPSATVVARERITDTVEDLSKTPGVTVLIHDGECALEKRRRWRRGKEAPPRERIYIHPDICDGCGDCGAKSNCPSVQPVDTELGRRTRIEQSSCVVDRACVQGDCPSFVSVTLEDGQLPECRPSDVAVADLPSPTVAPLGEPCRILTVGIGGTGVVTMNAILAHAALIDGLAASTLDQTGLAQKGGPVSSHLTIASTDDELVGNKIGQGQASVLLACDVLESAKDVHLSRVADTTVPVLNTSIVPTASLIRHVDAPSPDESLVMGAITEVASAGAAVKIPAGEIADRLFGDHMKSNIIALGAASQQGLLPIAPTTIEAAISLNGADVEASILAFRYGRLWVADQERVRALLIPDQVDDSGVEGVDLPVPVAGLPDAVRPFVARRVVDLVAYQNEGCAQQYVEAVTQVYACERELPGSPTMLTEAVASQLFKLMAYKDEYEVARLILDDGWRDDLTATFGKPRSVVHYLHPPMLRALGLRRKLRMGAWARPALHVLRTMRKVRGTPLDVFGYAKTRRRERELPGWYLDAVSRAMEVLTPSTYEQVVGVAMAADVIRGYEDVKLRNIDSARSETEARLQALNRDNA